MKKASEFIEKYGIPYEHMSIEQALDYSNEMYNHLPFSLEHREKKEMLTFVVMWALSTQRKEITGKVKELFTLYGNVVYEQETMCNEFYNEFLSLIRQ
jgi:hypothetical protein